MAPKVYIDGHVGTTGLRIRDWLAGRDDLELLTLPEADRRSPGARREMIRASDLSVLCLPDDAAREAVGWAEGCDARILDASTAHRIADGWVYGLPELEPGQRDAIASARLVSNPGCWPSGVLLLLRPLIDAGILAPTVPVTIHGLSGYTGGGRPLVERWEDPAAGLSALPFEAPYALDRTHKHIPEIVFYSGGIVREPQFVPSVGPFRCGMRVEIPLHANVLERGVTGKRIWEALDERYRGEPFVRVLPVTDPLESNEHSFDPMACNDTNRMELRVLPHPSGHVLLMAVLDNLGKGAAGVAIQTLNLMLGRDETKGLPG
ncbi:MAG: N-acetyl-gamma-glutamyl-phosphate reductase [Deltaproteobacteria bacterium]|nr:N-acetyl-gamma-glutamyl-phosphate reductase [Deltaproteobacteria bacterium]